MTQIQLLCSSLHGGPHALRAACLWLREAACDAANTRRARKRSQVK